jgi:hypothetical protein
MGKKKKFYAVWTAAGAVVNKIYTDWNEVEGMHYNKQRGFKLRKDAEAWLQLQQHTSNARKTSTNATSTPPSSPCFSEISSVRVALEIKRKAESAPDAARRPKQRQRTSSSDSNILQEIYEASWQRVCNRAGVSNSDVRLAVPDDDAATKRGTSDSTSSVPQWPSDSGGGEGGCGGMGGHTMDSCDPDQRAAVEAVLDGKNIFLTGVAGTGKSHTLKVIQSELKRKGVKFAVLAPTGAAAVQVKGCTIHSFTKIGIPKIKKDFRRMIKRTEILREYSVWIVDEISVRTTAVFLQS